MEKKYDFLEEILNSKRFTNTKGEIVHIQAETSLDQCRFLQSLIRENKFVSSLEIGLAYGISALAIVEEVHKNGGTHCVIDKFQQQDWGNNGLDLIRQAGYDHQIEFYEDFSYVVLPELLAKGKKIDVVYIDSTKVFDWLLVDFFMIDKILKVGGIVTFDDTGYASIRKLMRFIYTLPHYSIEYSYPANTDPGILRKIAGKLISSTFLRKFIKPGADYTDFSKGINTAGCIAFRKTDEDRRDWKWDSDF